MAYGDEKDQILPEQMIMPVTSAFDFFIQMHLTERCNLSCRHCYQTGDYVDEMSLPEIRDAVSEISDTLNDWKEAYGINFSPSFNVTGGEPFLRKDLDDILSCISDQGYAVYLLTNGILADEKRTRSLSALGVKGVQVSIEGPEPIHDSIRGKGSFAGAFRGIANLLEASLTVTLNVTLSSLNAEYIDDIIDLAHTWKVHRLGFSRLVPSGRGEGLLKEMLGTENVEVLYNRIFALNTGMLEIVTGDPVASQVTQGNGDEQGAIPIGGCAAGVSGLTILPDGTMVPCRRLHVPIGNIRKDSFREVWATSEVLNALRNKSRYQGKCGVCRRWAQCRGCRAIAYAFSRAKGQNDFLAADPQCFIEAEE
jgi:AdoMet-dependent heme synthase